MSIKINDFCNCCQDQSILQLFSNKCFAIVENDQSHDAFCLKDYAYPVDGYKCFSFTVSENSEYIIFDNQIISSSPNAELEEDELFVRGIMLRIIYPINDNDGEEILITNKKARIYIENSENNALEYPIYDLYIWFTNPKSNLVEDLINKIKIINPNANYKIKISGLIIYGKSVKN